MSTKKRLKSASKPPKKAGNCIFADHKFNFSLEEEKVPGFPAKLARRPMALVADCSCL